MQLKKRSHTKSTHIIRHFHYFQNKIQLKNVCSHIAPPSALFSSYCFCAHFIVISRADCPLAEMLSGGVRVVIVLKKSKHT
jgi:hypothetical protein